MARAAPDVSIGLAVRRARTRSGKTQAALAESAELAVETVSRIERGIVMPSAAVLLRLAHGCGTTIDAMLREKPTRRRARAALARIVAMLEPLHDEDLDRIHRGLRALLGVRSVKLRTKSSS